MKQRIVYFDFLRIFAALAVVMAHTSTSQYLLLGSYHYSACFWDGLVRWGVPIFVMISGALFLEPTKKITINNIFKKYIFRIARLFVIWSLLYVCVLCVYKNDFSSYFIMKNFLKGHFHQWFLYMIAGLYLITPLLRPITEKKDKNLLLYLLIIWFIMASVIPFIKFIIPQTESFFDFFINKRLYFSFPLSFLGYFILGYYLHNYVNIKRNFIIIFIILFCFCITAFGDMLYSIPGEKPSFFIDSFLPFLVVISSFIFLIVKKKYSQVKQANKFILKLSDLTLGVYLIHPIFIQITTKSNLFGIINSALNDNNFITIPIVFVLVSFCSFFVIYLLSKIPFIRKYCL